jgi:hypothetical protein
MTSKSFHIEHKLTFVIGINFRFGLGFCVDKYSLAIDLGPCYFAVEW